MFISSLADALCIDILSVWLHANDVAKLDTACCSSKRKWLLDLFRSPSLSLRWDVGYGKAGDLEWFVLRNVKPRSLVFISYQAQECIFKKVTPLDKSKVTEVYLDGLELDSLSESSCAALINSCPRLDNLSLKFMAGFKNSTVPHIHKSVYQQLTKLNVCGLSKEDFTTDTFLTHTAHHCRSLTTLFLNLGRSENEGVVLVAWNDLLRNNQSIQMLTCVDIGSTINADFLTAVATHCHNLVEFSSSQTSDITMRHLTDVIIANPMMRSLVIMAEPGCGAFHYSVNKSNKQKNVQFCYSLLEICNDSTDGQRSLIELFTAIPNINALHIGEVVSRTYSITNNLLRVFAEHASQLSLLRFDSVDFDDTTVEVWSEFVLQCNNLRHLHFASAYRVSSAITAITETPNNITHLYFKDCTGMQDVELWALLTKNQQLTTICADRCYNISSNVIEQYICTPLIAVTRRAPLTQFSGKWEPVTEYIKDLGRAWLRTGCEEDDYYDDVFF